MSTAAATMRNIRANLNRPAGCLRQTSILSRYVLYRQFVTTRTNHTALTDPPKPKPKNATQLRRTAAASLPIRSNPTPTRGDIQPVSALTTAERYLLPQLRNYVPKTSRFLYESLWIPKWGRPGKEGEVFVFANGSFVCWGLGEDEARRFSREVIERSHAQVSRLVEPEIEDVDFVTDPNENTRLQGDLIILGSIPTLSDDIELPQALPETIFPQDTLLARYSFSQALARSSALSALESGLENYLSSVSSLPLTLSKTGKPGLHRRALIMKLGELMRFRQGLNLNRENFSDTPDLYWAEPALEGYFNSMTEALDMTARTRSVNDKITYAAEVQAILRELLTESTAHRMELIIIALIAVEVVICLVRDGPELWHMFFSSENKSAHLKDSETEH